MRVFVSGANGLVGEAVTRALLERGHEVDGLVRHLERGRLIRELGARVLVGDMLRPETYRQAAAEADAVIHCAELGSGGGRVTRRRLRAVHAADELMTRELADVCAGSGARFLYTSGCWVYGDRGEGWIDEETPYEPSLYAASHARMTEHLRRRAEREGLQASVIVPGMVYGPGSWFADFLLQLEQGRVRLFGSDRGYWSLVHWRDLGRAYALALERGRPGRVYNVVDDQPLRRREWLARLAEAVDQSAPSTWPLWVGRLLLGGPLAKTMTLSFRVRNRRAKEELGWDPQHATLTSGLAEVVSRVTRGRHGEPPRESMAPDLASAEPAAVENPIPEPTVPEPETQSQDPITAKRSTS